MGILKDSALCMIRNSLGIDTFTKVNGEEELEMGKATTYTQITQSIMENGWIIGNMVQGLIHPHKASTEVNGVMERDTEMAR